LLDDPSIIVAIYTRKMPKKSQNQELDIHKARTLLGCKPNYSIEENVKRSLSWYKYFYQPVSKTELYD